MPRSKVTRYITKALLWLFIINLGIALGAGLYESTIVFPQWLTFSSESGYHWNAEASRQANTGLRFWVYTTTVPLTLLTLANLAAAWSTGGRVRVWWVSAVTIALVERVMTFSYFIPTMVTLQGDHLPESEAVSIASQWGSLNNVRHALSFVALILAMKSFSMLVGASNGGFSPTDLDQVSRTAKNNHAA